MNKIAKKLLLASLITFSMGLASCGGGNDGSSQQQRSSSQPQATSQTQGSSQGSGDSSSVYDGPVVTFRLNYLSGSADYYEQQQVAKGNCATRPAKDPERDGYLFEGWFDAADGNSLFDFSEPITKKNTRVYAHWLGKLECTFDLNYNGAPAPTKVDVYEKNAVQRPTDPTRNGYQFLGWTLNKDAASDGFDKYYDFARLMDENLTLYAKWGSVGSNKVFRFEAEFSGEILAANGGMGLDGNTYSGASNGKGLIQAESNTCQTDASNEHFVHFLYLEGCNLKFEINSDAAGTAKIDMRLSAEYKESGTFSISPDGSSGSSKYTIKVNGQAINYNKITFTDIPKQGNGWKKFVTYPLTANVPLVQGKNTVEMITDNSDLLMGTASATAPMIDCLTFETGCNLSWLNGDGSQILL